MEDFNQSGSGKIRIKNIIKTPANAGIFLHKKTPKTNVELDSAPFPQGNFACFSGDCQLENAESNSTFLYCPGGK